MKARSITKRDGRVVLYEETKIAQAILKALTAAGREDAAAAAELAHRVREGLEKSGETSFRIEAIQDEVERTLMHAGYDEAAKKYILYRAKRTRVRESNTSLMMACDEITNADARTSNLKRDNANVDGNTSMGSMLQLGSAAAKSYNTSYLLTEEQAKAYNEGWIHIHDFDFYSLTTTCCQIDIDRLFTDGFNTGHGFLREPQSIQSYAALACIAIQSNQNDQHGGQGIPNFDYGLAKGVAKSYRKIIADNIQKALILLKPDSEWQRDEIREAMKQAALKSGQELTLSNSNSYLKAFETELEAAFGISPETASQAIAFAVNVSEPEIDRHTYQAMESVVHNLNSMHSRAGAQTPFSSINYGTDTSPEGRMIIRNILKATEAGLGRGETPIFPIQIFKLKEGVNYNPEDPTYDMFVLACKCSAKRLFPNFVNLDAPFNSKYYVPGRPETEIATMGCRTRVVGNCHDRSKETVFGRGNLSFTSINLPRLAIEAKGDEKRFFESLEQMMELVSKQLLDRFEIQAKKKVRNFPFLMGEGIWMDSDTLGPDDEIREVLKHGTLSMGFIGLAETLVSLYGHHHGESDEAQEKGLRIIQCMYDFTQRKSAETGMNFTLLATPAEGLSGRFIEMDKKLYGNIPGVTERGYYTNSFHIPVYYPISASEKIRREAPYHALTPAGHITYIEMDGDPARNLDAFMSVIRYMHDMNIGYGSINHPVDRDPVCGYVGIIGDQCPRCGRREGEAIAPEKLAELQRKYPSMPQFIGHV
ncbi:MAG: anaerobic ribonucleoside triphosphate reductase [Spirochaetaceae bacterium]|jgi:ribonucleoside-triphosphate reductase|nr:anaerobic ribonucleoside triphosphate reductase [Spirochaetaceae bacterium]